MMMNSKELKAEIRNKLQSLRTTIRAAREGKDVPRAIVEASVRDLDSLEGLVDGINE